jgi:hypothetical protein
LKLLTEKKKKMMMPAALFTVSIFASISFFLVFRASAVVLLVHLFAFLAVAAARLLEAVQSFHRQSWSLVSGRTRLVMFFLPSLFPSLPSPPFPYPVSIRKREQEFFFLVTNLCSGFCEVLRHCSFVGDSSLL